MPPTILPAGNGGVVVASAAGVKVCSDVGMDVDKPVTVMLGNVLGIMMVEVGYLGLENTDIRQNCRIEIENELKMNKEYLETQTQA